VVMEGWSGCVLGVGGEEPAVLNTGSLGECIENETVRRRNPSPKLTELHRVETLGQNFFGAANPDIYYGYAWWQRRLQQIPEPSPTPHPSSTPHALVSLLRNDVAESSRELSICPSAL
jgi:hypothetical protein